MNPQVDQKETGLIGRTERLTPKQRVAVVSLNRFMPSALINYQQEKKKLSGKQRKKRNLSETLLSQLQVI